jgi:hypothetical protein
MGLAFGKKEALGNWLLVFGKANPKTLGHVG